MASADGATGPGDRFGLDSGLPDLDGGVRAVIAAVDGVDGAERDFRRHLREQLHLNGTDLAALQLIDRMQRAGTAAHVSDIAHRLAISSGSATEVVNRLQRGDLIHRAVDPDDLRGRILHLTEATAVRLSELTEPLRTALNRLLGSFSLEEQIRLVYILTRIQDTLHEHTATGPDEPGPRP